MPSADILLAFFLATSVFAYMPGPAMLYATAQTVAGGRRAGWFAALGLHLGGYVHVVAAAFGLAILFETIPALYLSLKIAGAMYLIWLGIKMFRSTPNFADLETTPTQPVTAKSTTRSFWESVTVEVLNPKTALFFLAFLPQFTDPAAGWPIAVQLLVLGVIVNVMFSSADVVCVVLADRLSRYLKRSRTALPSRLGGSLLVALGVNLALSRH